LIPDWNGTNRCNYNTSYHDDDNDGRWECKVGNGDESYYIYFYDNDHVTPDMTYVADYVD